MTVARSTARPTRRAGIGRLAGLALLALVPLQAGCDMFEEPAQVEPPPPPPPRPTRPIVRPRTTDPGRAEQAEQQAAATPAEAARPAEQAAPSPPETEPEASRQDAQRPLVWRVVVDRTIGCAVPETVRLLRGTEGLGEAQPRLAAQARAEGRCSTVFRASEWTLVRTEGELVLLRLANPPAGVAPLELYFMRRDVTSMTGMASPASG